MAKLNLEALDLDRLNEMERTALIRQLNSHPFCWLWGMFLGLKIIFGLVLITSRTGFPGMEAASGPLISAAIFIGLALWIRTWSLPAAVLLLSWHLYANVAFLGAAQGYVKGMYWLSAVILLFGLFGCLSHRTLIRKATPDPNTSPEPASMDRIRQLIVQGEKSRAISMYRRLENVDEQAAARAVGEIRNEIVKTPSAYEGEIRDQVLQGQKIHAVRMFRQLHGVGLKDAKDAVDAIERGDPVPTHESSGQDMTGFSESSSSEEEIRNLVRQGQKILAVKKYRQLHNVGLKEAKDAIDEMQ